MRGKEHAVPRTVLGVLIQNADARIRLPWQQNSTDRSTRITASSVAQRRVFFGRCQQAEDTRRLGDWVSLTRTIQRGTL